MPGFLNNDGSELVGGLLPSGAGQALGLDVFGNLRIADGIRQAAISGQMFSVTTGKQNAPSGSSYPLALFSAAANSKNILIVSIQMTCGSGTQHDLRLITSDPAFATPLSAVNHKIGGPASSLTGASGDITTTNVAGATIGGTVIAGVFTGAGGFDEVLTNGATILLPAGTAGGIEAVITTGGANAYAINLTWIEF